MALSLRTIGHLKQNEVIGRTPGVGPQPAWGSSESKRAGKFGRKECDILEDLTPPSESGTCEHCDPTRNRSRGTKDVPTCGTTQTGTGAREALWAERGPGVGAGAAREFYFTVSESVTALGHLRSPPTSAGLLKSRPLQAALRSDPRRGGREHRAHISETHAL